MAMTETSRVDALRLQLPQRRRRIGVLLLCCAVAALVAQAFLEWLLPYDMAGLGLVRRALGRPGLLPQAVALAWGLACALLLWPLLSIAGRRREVLALLAGLLLGTARLAAGGAVAAVVMLLAAGVASLGWQSRREGGAPLLLGTALAVVGWDAALSSYWTLWPVCLALCMVFVWIERHHLQSGDRQLMDALAERERLIGDLTASRQALLALQRERTQLLAGIGHDLRQPLSALRLHAEALHARHGDPLLREQTVAADEALRMLDQFSDFAAIEQGALRSNPEPLELRGLLQSVADLACAAQRADAVSLRVHGRETWIRTDRTQLTRLLQNLVGNAVRHSLRCAEGRRPTVLVALRRHRGGWAIDVVDNGDGIAAAQLGRVFEPYVKLSGGGQGLGLAIVRGLAAQLGLVVAPVCSTPGRGTRFRVCVPTLLCCDAPAGADAVPDLTGRFVAVLDDDDAVRRAVVAVLQSAGAHCVEAPTLPRLAALLDEEIRFPDALVFDVELGSGGDGFAAAAQLRADWQTEVPALFFTGHAVAQRPLPARSALLLKPADRPTLTRAVAALLADNPTPS